MLPTGSGASAWLPANQVLLVESYTANAFAFTVGTPTPTGMSVAGAGAAPVANAVVDAVVNPVVDIADDPAVVDPVVDAADVDTADVDAADEPVVTSANAVVVTPEFPAGVFFAGMPGAGGAPATGVATETAGEVGGASIDVDVGLGARATLRPSSDPENATIPPTNSAETNTANSDWRTDLRARTRGSPDKSPFIDPTIAKRPGSPVSPSLVSPSPVSPSPRSDSQRSRTASSSSARHSGDESGRRCCEVPIKNCNSLHRLSGATQLQQVAVLCVGRRRAVQVCRVHHDVWRDCCVQIADNRHAALPARSGVERLMEMPVRFADRSPFVVERHLGFGEVDDRQARNRPAQQTRLDCASQCVDLLGITGRQRTDDSSSIRLERDQPFGGQALQSLAHGDLADAQFRRKIILSKPSPRLQFSTEDGLHHVLVDDFDRTTGVHRRIVYDSTS